MTTNGSSASRKWANGPSVPLTTPFREDETIDHEALAKQVVRLAKAGEGIVLLGTNGEGESRRVKSLDPGACPLADPAQPHTCPSPSERRPSLPPERRWTAMASRTNLFSSEPVVGVSRSISICCAQSRDAELIHQAVPPQRRSSSPRRPPRRVLPTPSSSAQVSKPQLRAVPHGGRLIPRLLFVRHGT